MRVFLGCPLSGAFKLKLLDDLHALQKQGADVKWVEDENLHLTLKFLGDCKQGHIDSMITLLREYLSNTRAVTTFLFEIAIVPDCHRPRMIWAQLDDTQENFKKIADDLQEMAAKCGVAAEERAFKPHITLGRFKSARHVNELEAFIQQIKIDYHVKQIFDTIILYKSTLTPQGSIYEALEEVKLKA